MDYAVNKAVTVGTRIYFARTRTNPYTLSFPWVSIPYITVKNPDGSWTGVPSGVDTDAGNPRADIAKHHYKSSDLTGNADLYVDWNIWDGLTLNLTGSAHLGGGFDDNYSEASNLRRTPESDSYSKYLDYAEEYTFTSTLSYGKKFAGKHDFHVMAGFEAKNASYSYLASFSNVTLHSFDGTSAVAGYNNAKVINEDIRWESIQTLDVGLDMEFFKNRLAVSFDWYQRITKDMIYALSVPNSSGITKPSSLGTMATMPVNLGRIDNTGWELLVSYRNNVGGFNYAVSANVSQNRNRVVDLGLPTAYIYGGGGHPFTGTSPCKTVNGMPISSFWGLRTDGMITSQAEIDELNATARAKGHEYYHQRLTGVGDLKFVDLNGDGTIDDNDRTFC